MALEEAEAEVAIRERPPQLEEPGQRMAAVEVEETLEEPEGPDSCGSTMRLPYEP